MSAKTKQEMRVARHDRLRKGLKGTPARPRLAVLRSLKHIYAQIIDDTTGRTLCSASSMEKSLGVSGTCEGAKKLGETIAKRAQAKGLKAVLFDRGGFRYHGRVASLAEGARSAALEF